MKTIKKSAVANGDRMRTSRDQSQEQHDYIESPRPFPVSVDIGSGEQLEVTDIYTDGISFISPRPVVGGKRVEVVICQAIQVEGIVVGLARMPAKTGGYLVRLRFHKTSAALNGLIYQELTRMMAEVQD